MCTEEGGKLAFLTTQGCVLIIFLPYTFYLTINQSEDKNEELKLSPLGTDEINSVIKSFKNSTFNQEELYKKDEKNFVKKNVI